MVDAFFLYYLGPGSATILAATVVIALVLLFAAFIARRV